MHGFKEDFAEWRKSLSSDEQALLLKKAQNQYDKKFRKSDDFTKQIDPEKEAAFEKIMEKFMETERDDYKKEVDMKVPDYDALKFKASQTDFDWSLTSRITPIDRMADRRYYFAKERWLAAGEKGEIYGPHSPQMETQYLPNSNEAEHQALVDGFKLIGEVTGMKVEDIPPVGEPFPVEIGVDMNYHTALMSEKWDEGMDMKEKIKAVVDLRKTWVSNVEDIEKDAVALRDFFRSAKDNKMPGKTKADIMKEVWKEMKDDSGKPLPALDEEALAELAKEPAVIEGEVTSWGTADVLYRAEAIDSFKKKYLLGIFDTFEEAEKAFESWNAEYEKAREGMIEERAQWSKQQQAYLDEDRVAQDRLLKAIEEARR